MIRVGDWGGYMELDCDEPAAVHKFCSMLPAFVFEARPLISIEDAVRVELEAMAFRGMGSSRNEAARRHCLTVRSRADAFQRCALSSAASTHC